MLVVNFMLVILLVSVVEFASILLRPKPSGNLVAHNRLNHMWKPNYSHTHSEWINTNPEFPEPYIHYYNQQGWLEKYDIQKKKPKSIYRIFYIGDSFTEGTCPMNQSVSSIVERRLNQLVENDDLTFEVINTGTCSYSPTLFYLLVRYVIMDYSPDLIVVNIDMTDDFDDWKYNQTLVRDNEGNPLFAPQRDIYNSSFIDTENGLIKVTLLTRLQLFLSQYSYTYSLIESVKRRVFGTNTNDGDVKFNKIAQDSYQRWAWCRSDWNNNTMNNVSNSIDILRRLGIWCQQNKIKILFTGVPHYWQYSGSADGKREAIWSSRPHYEFADLAKELAIPYLNSYEQLKPIISGTPQTTFYYNNNMHFNPRGYAIWAEAHVRFLISRANELLCEGCLTEETTEQTVK